MSERTVRLLVPTAEPLAAAGALSARAGRLGRVAFLHNGQPFYDAIAPDLARRLRERPGLAVQEYRKPAYSSPAEPAVLEAIRGGAEAAIVGLAC